ncbi:MAG: hypothetical protein WCE79_15195 [Xanthobacteraceae bacterium]
MQRRTGFALRPAIAAFTVAASAIALAGASEAAPDDACLRAPKGVAPQGQHWYYRTERPSVRKCWYLAEKGLTVTQRAAARTAPQDESDEETDTPATPLASAPVAPAAKGLPAPAANVSPTPVASAPAAPPAEPPAPVITTLTTRNVSNPSEIARAPIASDSTPTPAANLALTTTAVAEATPAGAVSTLVERMSGDKQALAAVAEQPPAAPATGVAISEPAGESTETMSTLQLLLGAIALTGFLASGLFLVMALLRRRSDVLNVRRETDALPFEESPEMAAEEEGPAFQPLRALDPIRQRDLDPMRQHDDVDEILQRLARRRRAA